MNAEQKMRIPQLRYEGKSYSEIAEMLGLPLGTIQSHCRRNNLGGNGTKDKSFTLCKQCGKVVRQDPKRREKLFCSNNCRYKWWAHHSDERETAKYQFTCPQCGVQFESYGAPNRKYCSKDCYFQHKRSSKEERQHDEGTAGQ